MTWLYKRVYPNNLHLLYRLNSRRIEPKTMTDFYTWAGVAIAAFLLSFIIPKILGKIVDKIFTKPYPVYKSGVIIITGKWGMESSVVLGVNLFENFCFTPWFPIGASSGIGRHTAAVLAQKGYIVYAGVRKEADAASLNSLGIKTIRPVILDVCNQKTIETSFKTVSEALEKEGHPLVAVINNGNESSHIKQFWT